MSEQLEPGEAECLAEAARQGIMIETIGRRDEGYFVYARIDVDGSAIREMLYCTDAMQRIPWAEIQRRIPRIPDLMK